MHSCFISDSSSDICIEDCYVSVGGDAISLKSGWDEYGIAYGKPTSNVYISRVYLQTSFGSALAFGSEMSGGISNVCAEQLHIRDAFTGIKLKTARGRGGFVKDVGVSDVEMENIHVALGITGQCGDHPDDHFNPDAYPDISGITFKNVIGANITVAGELKGIPEDPFTSICLSNISLSMTSELSTSWVCSDVLGFSHSVFPEPCSDLQLPYSNSSSVCFSLLSPVGHAEAFWDVLFIHHSFSTSVQFRDEELFGSISHSLSIRQNIVQFFLNKYDAISNSHSLSSLGDSMSRMKMCLHVQLHFFIHV